MKHHQAEENTQLLVFTKKGPQVIQADTLTYWVYMDPKWLNSDTVFVIEDTELFKYKMRSLIEEDLNSFWEKITIDLTCEDRPTIRIRQLIHPSQKKS